MGGEGEGAFLSQTTRRSHGHILPMPASQAKKAKGIASRKVWQDGDNNGPLWFVISRPYKFHFLKYNPPLVSTALGDRVLTRSFATTMARNFRLFVNLAPKFWYWTKKISRCLCPLRTTSLIPPVATVQRKHHILCPVDDQLHFWLHFFCLRGL